MEVIGSLSKGELGEILNKLPDASQIQTIFTGVVSALSERRFSVTFDNVSGPLGQPAFNKRKIEGTEINPDIGDRIALVKYLVPGKNRPNYDPIIIS